MSGFDYRVPPRSWDDISKIADNLRAKFGLADTPYTPIMELLETVLDQKLGIVRLEVGSKSEMKASEGHTCPNGEFIEFREDVYRDAWDGDARARFTAAHELGHLVLHTRVPLARAMPEQNVAVFRRSEPQANQFAAEFLMPRDFFQIGDDESATVDRHGVSWDAATHRLRFLRKNGLA